MVARYFEFQDEHSNKFWKVEIVGNDAQINYGKIGTNGQNQLKEFSSKEEAQKFVDKKIKEKLHEGYVEKRAQK